MSDIGRYITNLLQVTLSIFMSPDACPRSVRYICGCLQKAVVSKWPDERFVRTRVVSGFIFLRLLCPALLNPRQFGLVSEQPSPSATRSLVMVAKCLQNLANLVEFGGKVSENLKRQILNVILYIKFIYYEYRLYFKPKQK